jgi:hypothetical protein
MRIIFQDTNHFELQDYSQKTMAELIYSSNELKWGKIIASIEVLIENTGIGVWHSYISKKNDKKRIAEVKLGAGGVIILNYVSQRRKYKFKSAGIFKTRFVLFNGKGEELLALLPVINWDKQGHEFSVQVNDEYAAECSSLLILHAVHCANCCLGILNGTVPGQVSI